MRLDLFLKISRLMPRRSVAQEYCDAGAVDVNGSPAKSSKEIKQGDEITIKRRNRVTRIEVAAVPASKQVAKADAANYYRIIEETAVDDPGPLS